MWLRFCLLGLALGWAQGAVTSEQVLFQRDVELICINPERQDLISAQRKVTWYFNTEVIGFDETRWSPKQSYSDNDDKYFIKNRTLLIRKANYRDSGIYRCKIESVGADNVTTEYWYTSDLDVRYNCADFQCEKHKLISTEDITVLQDVITCRINNVPNYMLNRDSVSMSDTSITLEAVKQGEKGRPSRVQVMTRRSPAQIDAETQAYSYNVTYSFSQIDSLQNEIFYLLLGSANSVECMRSFKFDVTIPPKGVQINLDLKSKRVKCSAGAEYQPLRCHLFLSAGNDKWSLVTHTMTPACESELWPSTKAVRCMLTNSVGAATTQINLKGALNDTPESTCLILLLVAVPVMLSLGGLCTLGCLITYGDRLQRKKRAARLGQCQKVKKQNQTVNGSDKEEKEKDKEDEDADECYGSRESCATLSTISEY